VLIRRFGHSGPINGIDFSKFIHEDAF